MTKIIFFTAFLIMANMVVAQKNTYDIISYNAPKGWAEKKAGDNISYSKIDGSSWAQIAIYQHRNSEGDIQTDFDKDWKEIVSANKNVSSFEKTAPQMNGAWTTMSGSAVWQYNGENVATMLTVYSNKQVCVSVLCNATAQPYLKDYSNLLSTLNIEVGKVAETKTTGNTNTGDLSSLAGIWTYNLLETSGYINNMPQYTAGYFRREYHFNPDGTYLFLYKNWSVYYKGILFGYETGTWSVNGNTFTITPKQGKNEEWSKAASGRTTEWGSRIKSVTGKLEKVTYRYNIKYYSGTQNYALELAFDKPTEREATALTKFSYSRDAKTRGLVDLPPGTKIDVDAGVSSKQQQKIQ